MVPPSPAWLKDFQAAAGAHDLINRAVLRMRDNRMLSGESHAPRVDRGTDKSSAASVRKMPALAACRRTNTRPRGQPVSGAGQCRVHNRLAGSHCSR